MTHAKLRAIGLSLMAALGLLAVTAAAAQADNEFLLLHPGKLFAEEKVAVETYTGKQEGVGRMIVPKLGFEIGCNKGEVIEGLAYATLVHATVKWEECSAWAITPLPGIKHYWDLEEKLPCNVGEIVVKVRGVPVLHKGETFVLFEGLGEGPISTISFASGTGCPLPLKANLTGDVVGLPTQLNVEKQLIEFHPLITLLWQEEDLSKDTLFYGVNEAYLEGSFYELLLTGAFKDKPWGAH